MSDRREAVLFDLGNTLAAYYRGEDFRPILERSIARVSQELRSRDLPVPPLEKAMPAALTENTEAADFSFTPLAERLGRIFGLSLSHDPNLSARLCECFLGPIFDAGRVYEEALPVLDALRRAGHRTAIVSNAPWGSPPELWRRELERLGLAPAVDGIVLCGDVGWRKPAPQIFLHAAEGLGVPPGRCLFVGDDLQWDVEGSAAVGMHPVLIDRDDRHTGYGGDRIRDLHGVLDIILLRPIP